MLFGAMSLMVVASLAATTLVIVSLATPLSASATATAAEPKGSYGKRLRVEAETKEYSDARLPKHLKPIHYRIRLMPFIWPGNFTTAGELDVTVACLEAAYNVTLNAKDVDIIEDSVKVFLDDGDKNLGRQVPLLVSGSSAENSTDQDYVIKTSEELKAGSKYRVQLRFVAQLNDLLQGFYRSSYLDATTGKKRWLAVTQFSPVDARRSYPCFDEPELKATFQVSIARTLNMTSRSNMPLEMTEPVEGMPGWVWDHYPNTVPMSTYLTAFLVSDFKTLGKLDGDVAEETDTLVFNVWSRPDAINQTTYAREIGPSILHYYEEYFGIPFPLPKLDMVAVPDFGFSAMENWGLITFRESAMLFDSKESTTTSKQNIAMIIGHELAHQWFGNLVTPAWWDDLWLKEGFASYVEYIGVNYVEPTWKILDQFPLNEIQDVFFLDALESSHPISVKVDNPDQIRQIFDRISYGKGASVIRMMNHFLGEKTFRAGLTSYLMTHGYSNAVQDDLWESLTIQAHLDGTLPADMTVKEVMDTWTLQTGYPVVKLVRDYENGSASLFQERFLLFRKEKELKAENSSRWWIPITYTTQDSPYFGNTLPSFWMEPEDEKPVELNLPPGEKWVVLNIQETGYFRVNYDSINWKMLTEQLTQQAGMDKQIIPPSTRSQLLDDALNFARSGLIPYSIALDLCLSLEKDIDYLPWASAFKALGHLDLMLTNTPIYKRFKEIMLVLSHSLVESVGWADSVDDKEHIKALTRVIALKWACRWGDEQCVTEAKNRFALWMNGSEIKQNMDSRSSKYYDSYRISPDLRGVVYCTGIKYGSSSEWEFAWQRYLTSNVGTERDVLLDSLGCTKELYLLKRYLEWVLDSSSGIRKQDGYRVFTAVASNPLGSTLAFDFLQSNWKKLLNYYGLAFSRVASMVSASTIYMNTPIELSQLRQFWKDQEGNLGTTERSFNQSIERVEANVQWMERSHQEVRLWLSNH